jgi:hypothetical protein
MLTPGYTGWFSPRTGQILIACNSKVGWFTMRAVRFLQNDHNHLESHPVLCPGHKKNQPVGHKAANCIQMMGGHNLKVECERFEMSSVHLCDINGLMKLQNSSVHVLHSVAFLTDTSPAVAVTQER